jgi:hypothetical protein
MPGTESVSHCDLVVCACREHVYTARDAIDAAIFRGELETKWKEFLERVEAEKQADELGLDLDESAISSAAEAFRYEKDLITAEETEAWLTNRGLTLDDFIDYFSRQYWRSRLDQEVVADEVAYHSASPELREPFLADLILCGELDRMTSALMWRLAARCADENPDAGAIADEERKFFHRHGVKPAQLPNWLESLGRDSPWFHETVTAEAAYRTQCDSMLAPAAYERELVGLRLSLTQFEAEIIELESHDAAKEAMFCVREDGMSMEEVATEGRYPYRRVDFVLEDIPADAQQRFLSATAGDLLEPMARGDGFELWRIVKRIEPQLDDPTVKSRIHRRLHDRHFSELISKHVEQRLGGANSAE